MKKTPLEILTERLIKGYEKELNYLKSVNKLHYFNGDGSYDFVILERMREYGCEEYIKLLEQ